MRVKWRLVCTNRHLINLKDIEDQIENVVIGYGGRNVMVGTQSFSFDWSGDEMSVGQSAALGRLLAKIDLLGRNADVYHFVRKGSKKRDVSRQIFRASKDLG